MKALCCSPVVKGPSAVVGGGGGCLGLAGSCGSPYGKFPFCWRDPLRDAVRLRFSDRVITTLRSVGPIRTIQRNSNHRPTNWKKARWQNVTADCEKSTSRRIWKWCKLQPTGRPQKERHTQTQASGLMPRTLATKIHDPISKVDMSAATIATLRAVMRKEMWGNQYRHVRIGEPFDHVGPTKLTNSSTKWGRIWKTWNFSCGNIAPLKRYSLWEKELLGLHKEWVWIYVWFLFLHLQRFFPWRRQVALENFISSVFCQLNNLPLWSLWPRRRRRIHKWKQE